MQVNDEILDYQEELPIEDFFPGVGDRIKAAFFDSIVMVGFMFLFSFIYSQFGHVDQRLKILSVLFVFVLYDPIFTALRGQTIGHQIQGIIVKRRSNQAKNINLFAAFVRYMIKVFLGVVSIFTVGGNRQNLAIHDMVSDSIVLFK